MELHNRTHCPDDIIRGIVLRAGRHAGANLDGVHVFVNQSRRATTSGLAYYADSVTVGGVKVPTNCGWFSLALPAWTAELKAASRVDATELAYRVYWTAFHEWHHIHEYQQMADGFYFPWSRRRNGRRPPYSERPEEIRAMAAEAEARSNPLSKGTQAAVLKLAAWMEGE